MLLVLFLFPIQPSSALVSEIKPIEDVVRGYGYGLQTHKVISSDGYKLTVHRLMSRDVIVHPPTPVGLPHHTAPPARGGHRLVTDATVDYGVPVLLVEGILQSSASNLAKGKGIVYSLADLGFDVWLTNYRGNMYSREHVDPTLSPEHPAFWNFTLHEMGTRDLPAVIDYVLASTRREKLLYTGFSMGTTMFWIMASLMPEYQAKVAAMVAVGPVARPSNMAVINKSVLRGTLSMMLSAMFAVNYCEVMSYDMRTASVINRVCNGKFSFLCQNFLANMNYLRKAEVEINAAFKQIPYSPAGIATKVLIHFIQIAGAGRFQQFDYGPKLNQLAYGTKQPPEYDLKKITLPLYFVYSEKDQVATQKDIEWLSEQLPRKPERRILTVNNFRHVDFSLNVNLETLLTRPLTSLIAELAEEHRSSLALDTYSVTNGVREDVLHTFIGQLKK